MSAKIILGIDEVGRGPWAGPLVVGAVILGPDFPTEVSSQLADSKKLTAKKREQLAHQITQFAAAQATGWVTAAELDQSGLSAALKLATRRAVKQILAQKTPFTEIVIDGTINFLQNTPLSDRVTTLKKADSLIKEVSAASIIAKVARDRYMAEISSQYPAYGFEKHVGYGTALHRAALLNHGICPEHRRSFRPIRAILDQNCPACSEIGQNCHLEAPESVANFSKPSTTARGQTAELAVAEHLKSENHAIIAHNFKTKAYEIDLISVQNHQIFFTEVKYSQNPAQETSALLRVTPAKLRQMRFAAEAFLANHPEFSQLEPMLAAAAVHGREFAVDDWVVIS